MSPTSLKDRIEHRLKPDLLADRIRVSDYEDLPFAILLYDPAEEMELRTLIEQLRRDLYKQGRYLEQVNLTRLMWEAVESVLSPAELFDVERQMGLDITVETLFAILSQDEQAPLHESVKEILLGKDPKNQIAILTHAGGLFPAYRTNSLLENLKGVTIPTILCYPGTLHGAKALSFMDELEADPNYRPRIY